MSCKERRSSLSSSWLVINLPPLPNHPRLTLKLCHVMITMRGLMVMMMMMMMMVLVLVMVVMFVMVVTPHQ